MCAGPWGPVQPSQRPRPGSCTDDLQPLEAQTPEEHGCVALLWPQHVPKDKPASHPCPIPAPSVRIKNAWSGGEVTYQPQLCPPTCVIVVCHAHLNLSSSGRSKRSQPSAPHPHSAGMPYPFLPWDGTLPVHEVHCTVGVFCRDSHKTLRTTTQHVRATAARGAIHRGTQVSPPPTARQPNLNRPHHRDGVTRGPLLCRTQKESFPYKWVVFSPSFPLLGESAESDPRHIQSPAKDGRAAISWKPWLLRPFPRSPAQ